MTRTVVDRLGTLVAATVIASVIQRRLGSRSDRQAGLGAIVGLGTVVLQRMFRRRPILSAIETALGGAAVGFSFAALLLSGERRRSALSSVVDLEPSAVQRPPADS